VLTGRSFFPELISEPFRHGLHEAFAFAIVACLIAAVASWFRGQRYVDGDVPVGATPASTNGARVTPAPARETAAT
jgi:hypothetical protein